MRKVTPVKYDFAAIGDVNATRELARFALGTGWSDLGDEVAEHVRRLLIDCIGVALGATGEPDLPILLDYCATLGGEPQASVWGRAERLNVANAAMVNSQLSAILDMDDTYLSDLAAFHGSGQVIPAALAIGEWLGSSGADVLAAIAVGHEVSMRVMLSLGITLHRQRWYTVSVAGPFGAAAACGKLLGLNEDQMVHALGIAGVQAAGLIEPLGSMTGAFQYARCAAAGVGAALLAQRGFTAGPDILTGKFGFHSVFHSDQDMDRLYGELGKRWSLLELGFKPYSCGINLHALLAGVIELRERHGLSGGQIAKIALRTNPHVLVPTGLREPKVGREGKFSVYHSAAVALIDGDAGPRQYTDARVLDPEVIALREKVEVTPDDAVRRDESFVAIHLNDGRTVETHVAHAPGTVLAPYSTDQIVAKFHRLSDPVLGGRRSAAVIEALRGIERAADISSLTALLAGDGL